MASVFNNKVPINEDLKYVLEVLSETAINNFDDDRGITQRELHREFIRVIESEPELQQSLSVVSNPDLSNLLESLKKYLTESHWNGNNLETLLDAYRTYEVNAVY